MVGLAARCGPGRGARCLRLQVRSGRVSVRVYYVRLYVRMAFSETQTTLRTASTQQTSHHSSQSTFKFSGGTATHIPWPLSLSVLRLSRSTGTRCCEAVLERRGVARDDVDPTDAVCARTLCRLKCMCRRRR